MLIIDYLIYVTTSAPKLIMDLEGPLKMGLEGPS